MAKKGYIGNPHKREFHQRDPKRQTKNCQVGEVKHQLPFRTGKLALAAGYDPCWYCCKHWTSTH